MATVTKRRGKWCCDFRDQRGKRHSFFFRTRREADDKLAEVRTQISEGTFTAKRDAVRFEELAESYIERVKIEVRTTTAREYEEDIRRHIVPYFSTQRVQTITVRNVED